MGWYLPRQKRSSESLVNLRGIKRNKHSETKWKLLNISNSGIWLVSSHNLCLIQEQIKFSLFVCQSGYHDAGKLVHGSRLKSHKQKTSFVKYKFWPADLNTATVPLLVHVGSFAPSITGVFVGRPVSSGSQDRDERTVIFYDPDSVLNFEYSVQPSSKKFKEYKVQVQSKSKKFTKYSFFTIKMPWFSSINTVRIRSWS